MTPLEFQGPAQLAHINARKEGPEGEKILAADLKFALTTGNDILIAFHPQLRLMLFTKEGELRFPLMGAVEWDYDFRDMVLELDPGTLYTVRFDAVRLKKWHFAPRLGHKVDVTFQAKVKPDEGQFERLGQFLLADAIRIKVYSANGDLFGTKDAAPQGESGSQSADAGDGAIVSESKSDDLHTPPHSASSPAVPTEDHDNVVPAFNSAGTPLGFRLDKREHPVGTSFEQDGITYDVVGQGAMKIVLQARVPLAEPPPAPLELNDELIEFMRSEGRAEAKKLEDERDFDLGFAAACQNAKLSKAFVDEHLSALESAYTDGFEEESAESEP